MTSKLYEIVTDKIIAALESGTPPWRKPWQAGIPRNAISNHPYSGINALLLNMSPYSDPSCLTMNRPTPEAGRYARGRSLHW
jgi:antirestriction protein ArdC